MKLLDLFCGRGGWTKGFLSLGWQCVGVDIVDHGYPAELVIDDVRALSRDYIDSFDAVVSAAPCEEFARAWLPWLRCDKTPAPDAISLLELAVEIATAKPNRIAELFEICRPPCGGGNSSAATLFGATCRQSCRSSAPAKKG